MCPYLSDESFDSQPGERDLGSQAVENEYALKLPFCTCQGMQREREERQETQWDTDERSQEFVRCPISSNGA